MKGDTAAVAALSAERQASVTPLLALRSTFEAQVVDMAIED